VIIATAGAAKLQKGAPPESSAFASGKFRNLVDDFLDRPNEIERTQAA